MIRSAVVTGATSMVGSAVIRACLKQGVRVLAIMRPGSSRGAIIPINEKVSVIEWNLEHLDRLDTSSLGRFDAFFDIGWTGSASGLRNDTSLQAKNIDVAICSVQVASKLGCGVFIGAGSQAECGRIEGDLKVDTPANPETGYGAAKYASQVLTRIESEKLGIRHIWSRILSVYGPGDAPQTMIMSTIATAIEGENPKCTPGQQLWDYLYSDDCGAALLSLANKGKHGVVYPIGSGVSQPLSNYVNTLCSAINPMIKPDFGAIPYSDKQVMNLRADITELSEDTGFVPSVSFEDGIRRTIAWYKTALSDKQARYQSGGGG